MTGDQCMGFAAIIASVATLAGVLGNIVLQLRQAKLSARNAAKLDEVHAATVQIASQTGTHQIIE